MQANPNVVDVLGATNDDGASYSGLVADISVVASARARALALVCAEDSPALVDRALVGKAVLDFEAHLH